MIRSHSQGRDSPSCKHNILPVPQYVFLWGQGEYLWKSVALIAQGMHCCISSWQWSVCTCRQYLRELQPSRHACPKAPSLKQSSALDSCMHPLWSREPRTWKTLDRKARDTKYFCLRHHVTWAFCFLLFTLERPFLASMNWSLVSRPLYHACWEIPLSAHAVWWAINLTNLSKCMLSKMLTILKLHLCIVGKESQALQEPKAETSFHDEDFEMSILFLILSSTG